MKFDSLGGPFARLVKLKSSSTTLSSRNVDEKHTRQVHIFTFSSMLPLSVHYSLCFHEGQQKFKIAKGKTARGAELIY